MMAFININRQSMIRGLGWTMLDAGRKLEQSLQLISLMEVMASPVKSQMVEHLLQEAVLKTNENLVSYRFKYRSHLNFKLVLQLFILDTENPRSLIFQLTKFKNNLLKIPSSKLETIEPEHILLINNLMNLLEELNTEHLAFKNSDSDRYEMLQQKLADLKHLLYNISDLISKFYFKHAVGQKQLFK
jgi:uncharacterized alpha-E superfamily protein